VSEVESFRSYGGVPVAHRRDERRTRFIEAALTVFASQGYARSTIADICSAAGLSKRQFYEQFANGEELLLATYDKIQGDARSTVQEALAALQSNDIQQIVATAITAFLTYIEADQRRSRVSFVEIVGVSERIEQHRLDDRKHWALLIRGAAEAAIGPDAEPRGGYALAATAFIGSLYAVVHEWSLTEPRQPVGDLVEILTRVLLALVAPPAS
jgi:AcrR family transcriptional regulator